MQLEQLIKDRRSITNYDTSKEISYKEIQELLDIAVWVPNHKMTQPWRFILIDGETKQKLGEINAKQGAKGAATAEEKEKKAEALKKKITDVPLWIAVVLEENTQMKFREEDYASASMLIQNFSLLAWEKGIGTIWKTNTLLENADARELLQIRPGERNIGLLQVGFIGKQPKVKPRVPASERTTVLN
ncbi:nitroreductase family protein [Terribacillus saccharophilus]|uniref:nitroreductase family protein n=1 Tax=Terribacillus saccharophilus TaxID=361277 RepID=UPI000C9BFE56|nr:nitroreductase [Terribacillus goriensis]MEC0281846.1 nitroreductase [Terribacillus saccharophilus]MEC0291365.1 nitroreductase [Terribacillus saccharophilus]